MTNVETQAVQSLSKRLREVSFSGHGGREDWQGETKGGPSYYEAYLNGGLNRAGVAGQVAQHFLIYEAIEAATARHRERLRDDFAFWLPELHRVPSLREDLQFWLGDDWERIVREKYTTPGIKEYVDRINEVSDSLPMFVAHHYTRYLADLSGGLMIARMFEKSYDIQGDEGVRFYRFPEIDDPVEFKDHYRALLDGAGFSAEEQDRVVAEVALAYRLNSIAGADLNARMSEFSA